MSGHGHSSSGSTFLDAACCGIGSGNNDRHYNSVSANDLAACSLTAPQVCIPGILDVNTIVADNIITNMFTTGEQIVCSDYPLCENFATGCEVSLCDATFCGAIHQYINDAWGIYRSPGTTEVTVGAGGDNTAPGANYSSVQNAIDNGGAFSNCRLIRITDNVTEAGNIVFPGAGRIYVDPGVTLTVNGTISAAGDLLLDGAISQNSSSIVFNNAGSAAITGTGPGVRVSNLNITCTGTAALFATVGGRHIHVDNVVYRTSGAPLFVDGGTPLQSTVSFLTLVGTVGIAAPPTVIGLTNPLSQVTVSNLFLEGTWGIQFPSPTPTGSVLLSTNNTTTWSHIVNRSTAATLVLSSDVQNLRTELGSSTVLSLTTPGVRITDARVTGLDLTSGVQVYLTNVIVTGTLNAGTLPLPTGTIIENLTIGGAQLTTTTLSGNARVDGLALAATSDWILNQQLDASTLQVSQINVRDLTVFHTQGSLQVNSVAIMIDTLRVGRNFIYNAQGAVPAIPTVGAVNNLFNLSNFLITGTVTIGSSNVAGNGGAQVNFIDGTVGGVCNINGDNNLAETTFTNFTITGQTTIISNSRTTFSNGVMFTVLLNPVVVGDVPLRNVLFSQMRLESTVLLNGALTAQMESLLTGVTFDTCTFFRFLGSTVSVFRSSNILFSNISHFNLSQFGPTIGNWIIRESQDVQIVNAIVIIQNFIVDQLCNNIQISNSIFQGPGLAITGSGALLRFYYLCCNSSLSNVSIGSAAGGATGNNGLFPVAYGGRDRGDFDIWIGNRLAYVQVPAMPIIPALPPVAAVPVVIDNTIPTNSLKVNNLLIIPKRGQQVGTPNGNGDIVLAPLPITTTNPRTIGFYGFNSMYNNLRVLFYPGGSGNINGPHGGHYQVAVPVSPIVIPIVQIGQGVLSPLSPLLANESLNSTFDGIHVGWAGDGGLPLPANGNTSELQVNADDVTLQRLLALLVTINGARCQLSDSYIVNARALAAVAPFLQTSPSPGVLTFAGTAAFPASDAMVKNCRVGPALIAPLPAPVVTVTDATVGLPGPPSSLRPLVVCTRDIFPQAIALAGNNAANIANI